MSHLPWCAVCVKKLYADRAGKTDTLSASVLPRHHYQVEPLTTELQKLLLKKLCTAVAHVKT